MLCKFAEQLRVLKELVTSDKPVKDRIRAARGVFGLGRILPILDTREPEPGDAFEEWAEGLSDDAARATLVLAVDELVETIEGLLQPTTPDEVDLLRAADAAAKYNAKIGKVHGTLEDVSGVLLTIARQCEKIDGRNRTDG